MLLSYRYRIYPSKAIQAKLQEHLELCRWLYNRLLEELNRAREEGRRLTAKDTQALIVKLKREERPELGKVYSKVLQMVNYQLWGNIRALSRLRKSGRRVGRLRFKGKGWFKTLNYNQSGFRIDFERKSLILSKIGVVPIKLHRRIKGKVIGVIIKRTRSNKWYAIVQAEAEPEPLPKTRGTVGIDVGIRHFITDSDGRQVENPEFYRRTLCRIRILHRNLSRKKKGSKNWEKARVKLAKAYEKLVNQRDDFLHKLSRFYVDNYDVIVVEDLSIQSMVRNGNLAQKILDASWGKFFQMLLYKAERAGRAVVKVNPRGTSKEGDRSLDRDYRAAINILNRGLVGLGRPEVTPVERGPLLRVPAAAVVTGQVLSMKQEAPCVSKG